MLNLSHVHCSRVGQRKKSRLVCLLLYLTLVASLSLLDRPSLCLPFAISGRSLCIPLSTLFSSRAHSLFLGPDYGSSYLHSGDHSHSPWPPICTIIPSVASSSGHYEALTLLYLPPHISSAQASIPLPPIRGQLNRHHVHIRRSRRHAPTIFFDHGRPGLLPPIPVG